MSSPKASRRIAAYSSSLGATSHMLLAQVAKAGGADLRRLKVVTFGGSNDSITNLLGGHIDLMGASIDAMVAQYKAGTVRIRVPGKSEEELVEQAPSWAGWSGDQPGVSAFLREGDRVFHTYSAYERALDVLMGTYNWLDLTARGRQEEWEQPPGRSDGPAMSWLHRHDQYGHD